MTFLYEDGDSSITNFGDATRMEIFLRARSSRTLRFLYFNFYISGQSALIGLVRRAAFYPL
jgi:hypothetical protein